MQDRSILVNTVANHTGDGPVIVWLKSALRVHENPAIDVGRLIAQQYNVPLLIYQAIDERYPWASLRHHNMLLDGAADLHQGCQALGLRYVLHLARDGHRQSAIKELSQSASCIVTDMFPLPPWSHWVANVGKDAKCPVVEVDCHCVIPMPLFGKSVDRPFKFRDATKRMRKKMVQQSWPKVTVQNQNYDGKLPFTPIDLEADILVNKNRIKLLQECNIDPTILPIWSQRGGEIITLNKWQKFLDNNLSGYARRRNNAADPEGVSRLSAAFHYGFLSPMKVAREAAAIGTKSADKYLDELLIFREHAWHHVASKSNPYSSVNLPHWALESWNNTAQDPRPVIVSSHELEYARSPNLLWNLCQKSLLRHGELHNNLRMTWGKSFPRWTNSLEDSLSLSQKYNDKYALDGRDPSSIAGVQWCHGLFDRPFFPSMPVMGVVRKRELETHNSRLDTEAYATQINRSPNSQEGVFLVACHSLIDCYVARVLSDNGYSVNYCEDLDNKSLTG
ncbi:MAG: deoxyribodipyrimidine photo-lyase, partial [Candidatus Poseidoniaceae archaeon]|nr:deoxyribodipyrimidine photo-lyase [Candidatus Poseidoniaceae archaeon]